MHLREMSMTVGFRRNIDDGQGNVKPAQFPPCSNGCPVAGTAVVCVQGRRIYLTRLIVRVRTTPLASSMTT